LLARSFHGTPHISSGIGVHRQVACLDALRLALLFAEGTEDTHAAESETDDGSECGNQHDIRAEMKEIGQHRTDGEYEAQYI
jgi:hypothetical protein